MLNFIQTKTEMIWNTGISLCKTTIVMFHSAAYYGKCWNTMEESRRSEHKSCNISNSGQGAATATTDCLGLKNLWFLETQPTLVFTPDPKKFTDFILGPKFFWFNFQLLATHHASCLVGLEDFGVGVLGTAHCPIFSSIG